MDHVRSHRARYQVMGFGKEAIILDTEGLPEKAIRYTGPFNTAENLAEGLNRGHDALTDDQRVDNFARAYQNILNKA